MMEADDDSTPIQDQLIVTVDAPAVGSVLERLALPDRVPLRVQPSRR